MLVSDRETAGALERAARRGIRTAVLPPKAFPDDATFASALLDAAEGAEADFVALAGYLRKIPQAFTAAFSGRMVNVHPALLPSFGGKGMYGLRVHEAVLAHGAKVSGATVHLVDEAYDTGPIVMQRCVDVLPDDTPDALAARVLRVEHEIYPAAIALFAEGRVQVNGRTVTIRTTKESDQPDR